MTSIPQPRPFGVLYLIENTVTHTAYVGITTRLLRQRYSHHVWCLKNNRHQNPHLQSAWNKYGGQAFECVALEEHDSQQALDEAEIFHIEYLRAIGVLLYNQKAGGGFGGVMNAESRAKISAVHKGKPKSAETRRRMSEGNRGVPRNRTPEGEARLQEARRRAFQQPEYREKRRQAALGRKHTEESRRHMSDVQSLRFQTTYRLHSPDGVVYTTQRLRQFCDEHGLKYTGFRNIIDGNCRSTQGGWTIERISET